MDVSIALSLITFLYELLGVFNYGGPIITRHEGLLCESSTTEMMTSNSLMNFG